MTFNGNYFQGAPVLVNATVLSGIQKAAYVPNQRLVMPDSDGRAVKTLATEGVIQPVLAIDSLNLAQMMTLLSVSPGEIPYLVLTALGWYGRKVDTNSPGFAAGTVHEKGAATAGVLLFSGLQGNCNDPAVMSLMAHLSSNGTAHPVAWSQVAAPSDPNTIAPMMLDSLTIDGDPVDELESVAISAAVQMQIEHGALPYPRLVRPRMVDWTMTARHNDLTIERSKIDKAAAMSAVFKGIATGAPVRTTGTLTWTVTGLLHQGGSDRGASGNVGVTSVCRGRHDGTNQPSTWAYVP